jgi:hypothetical protein
MRSPPRLAPAFLAVGAALFPLGARAQAPGTPESLPLAVDLRKVEVGSWAEYDAKVGSLPLSSRWALVARDGRSNTIELTTKGKLFAKPLIMRIVLPADPMSGAMPPRPMVVQVGDDKPMLAPKDMPVPKFQRPDAKHLVGSEEIKVPAGAFKTSHYRETIAGATVDIWVSDAIPPIGVVKVVRSPVVDKSQPAAMQEAPFTQELAAMGKGGKPAITKKPKPYDDRKMRDLVAAPQEQ